MQRLLGLSLSFLILLVPLSLRASECSRYLMNIFSSPSPQEAMATLKTYDEETQHSLDYFLKYAWDEESGSFFSDIDFEGRVLNRERSLISMSRMIYGLSEGSTLDKKYLSYAERSTDFLLHKMLKTDEKGRYYFIGKVDALGNSLEQTQKLSINEQGYGLNGLVRLYQVTKNPKLLSRIRKIHQDFLARFHDPIEGGFFDAVSIEGEVLEKTKSYTSTVYVGISYLIEFKEIQEIEAKLYIPYLEEIGDHVINHFIDPKSHWIIENFTRNWAPDWRGWQKQVIDGQTYSIGVTGHNFQAAWFLMRLSELREISLIKRESYKEGARKILTKLLEGKAIDFEYGGVFDVFKREIDEQMWHTNKAWWQNIEAILALEHAKSIHLFENKKALSEKLNKALIQIENFYHKFFIDRVHGGEFAVVTREGLPVKTEPKGHQGKSVYHTTEFSRYMKKYLSQEK